MRGSRCSWAGGLSALLLLAACASGPTVPESGSAIDPAVAEQFMECTGTGSPTVVLIAGAWGWSKDWVRVVPGLSEAGRVCTYDRPGLGRSPGRATRTTVDAGQHADELQALLSSRGETGPYIVVGHSYGGLIARAFAARHPRAVAGIALLDPVPAGFSDVDPSWHRTLDEASPRTVMDLDRSAVATGGLRALTRFPLVLVSAGVRPSWLTEEEFRLWQREQDRTAAAAGQSLRLTAVRGSHQLADDVPALVVAAIDELRAAVRDDRPLATCGRRWTSLGAACAVPSRWSRSALTPSAP